MIVEETVAVSPEQFDLAVSYGEKMQQRLDHESAGVVIIKGPKSDVPLVKVSSPELASLAAAYVKLDKDALQNRIMGVGWDTVIDEIQRLAGSVLSQAEGSKS